ncbi:hypothetical protein OC835_001004 [Tilletia horrida]|nr:hypothetical protein OC835_001004 [Tilletia horrida]
MTSPTPSYSTTKTAPKAWWKSACAAQLYPASYADSNGDGMGDLGGIADHVDHLAQLGVDCVWISPFFKSPNVDMVSFAQGYDVSDYRDVDVKYGSLADWERLAALLKSKNIRLIHDLVVNHTSDQHAWFQESRSSRDNTKADWYIWRDAKTDAQGQRVEPNNWASIWGGSAWSWCEERQQYWFHIFDKTQPDLNWELPAVREAVKDTMRFWLEKGVAGFRLDAINFASKPTDFPDAPITDPSSRFQSALGLYAHGPRLIEFLTELHDDVLAHYHAFTVGESGMTTLEQALEMTEHAKPLQQLFTFDHLNFDLPPSTTSIFEPGPGRPRNFDMFREAISKWQVWALENDSWLGNFLSNHDQPRSMSNMLGVYIEDQRYRWEGAKLLALFSCALAGTLFVYQGEELGMLNVPVDWPISEYDDIVSKRYYEDVMAKKKAECEKKCVPVPDDFEKQVMMGIMRKARDNARTPMPWDDTPSAGFSSDPSAQSKFWMKVNPDNVHCNARAQLADPTSVFHFWRRALALRKSEADLLVYGAYHLLHIPAAVKEEKGGIGSPVFGFVRTDERGRRAVFVGNFARERIEVDLEAHVVGPERDAGALLNNEAVPAMSNYEEGSKRSLKVLEPFEARLYFL